MSARLNQVGKSGRNENIPVRNPSHWVSLPKRKELNHIVLQRHTGGIQKHNFI